MRNARLDEAQAEIKIAGRNINNLRYVDDTTLMAESKEIKSLLMKVKEEREKAGLSVPQCKTPMPEDVNSGMTVDDHLVTSSHFTDTETEAQRIVKSSVYPRLLIFLPAILMPACASSSPAFLMMYPAYKLNKQGDNRQP